MLQPVKMISEPNIKGKALILGTNKTSCVKNNNTEDSEENPINITLTGTEKLVNAFIETKSKPSLASMRQSRSISSQEDNESLVSQSLESSEFKLNSSDS